MMQSVRKLRSVPEPTSRVEPCLTDGDDDATCGTQYTSALAVVLNAPLLNQRGSGDEALGRSAQKARHLA
jgi:hypothetical protein